ncbi:MAG: hypothetical protein HFI92_06245 [Lachnospiraceae bacterium]|nr:hypothetical protein [Lachnospiraceae bacterium]
MTERKLWVKMFGGFSAGYGEEVLTFGRQRDSKFRQLFQILMTRPGQGFSKREIAKCLYGQEEVEDPNASLNNTIFRLRKYLETSPLPSGDYLVLNEGVLRFDGGIAVDSDVWNFENAAWKFEKEQDAGIKAELCRKACSLYQGEFLPWLSNEQWVIEKSCGYQKVYFRMLKYLLHYLKEEGDYRSMESVSARAAELYPYGGWEIWRIESLIALGRRKEAEETYQKTTAYVQETGGFLSKKQQERFRKIGARIRQPEGTEEDIGKCLMEPAPGQGAYACTLPGFSDCFRMLKRVMVRGGRGFSLILCTILDASGHPVSDREYSEKQEKKLCASFRKHLRKGDVYTKYSDSQYLLLCIGAKRENVADIGARIDTDYRKRCGGRGGVSLRLLDDGNMWQAGGRG